MKPLAKLTPILCLLLLLVCGPVRGQATLTVLYSFTGGYDGSDPQGRIFQPIGAG